MREPVSPSVNSRLAGQMSLGVLCSWPNSAALLGLKQGRLRPPLHLPVKAPRRLARTFTPGDTCPRNAWCRAFARARRARDRTGTVGWSVSVARREEARKVNAWIRRKGEPTRTSLTNNLAASVPGSRPSCELIAVRSERGSRWCASLSAPNRLGMDIAMPRA